MKIAYQTLVCPVYKEKTQSLTKINHIFYTSHYYLHQLEIMHTKSIEQDIIKMQSK